MTQPDQTAWNNYFAAIQSTVNGAWGQAVASYKGLKAVRSSLKLPFMTGSGETFDPGAWNQGLDQDLANLQAMVTIISGAFSDAISGKRKVAHGSDGDIGIAALPSDKVWIGSDGSGVYLMTPQGAAIQAQKGGVGLPWVPVIAGGVIVSLGQIYLATRAIDSIVVATQEKTTRTLALRDERLIQSGKATPEEVVDLNKATKEAIVATREAAAAPKGSSSIGADISKAGEQFTKVLITLGWLGLGGFALYMVAKMVPARGGGSSAPRLGGGSSPQLLASNPIDHVGADELVLLVNNTSTLSPKGQGRGRSIALNLMRKMIRGTYDHSKAWKAWMYVVDDAARETSGGTLRGFSKDTREAAAREIAKFFYRDVREGEYQYLLVDLKRLPFYLREDERGALCGFIGNRYRSAETLCEGHDPETQSISIAKAKQALRATKGDGGDYGTVPLAGGGLEHSIRRLWNLLAVHEGFSDA